MIFLYNNTPNLMKITKSQARKNAKNHTYSQYIKTAKKQREQNLNKE